MSNNRLRMGCFFAVGFLVVSGCTSGDEPVPMAPLQPEEFETIRTWLLCGDCVEGERDSVGNLADRAIPALAEVISQTPEFVADPLRRGLLRLWDPETYPDQADYLHRFMDNALERARVRAALSLGDVGAGEALLDSLVDLANDRGFGQDVINALRWARDTGPGFEGPVESVTILPHSLTIPRGSAGTLAVSVRGPFKQPSGASVTWYSLNPPVVSVDGNGEITARSEGTARIVARADSREDTAHVVVVAPEPANRSIRILAGNGQENPAGTSLPDPLRVEVTDSLGFGLQVPVRWTVLQGGGTVAAPVTPTNASGRAANQWTLGSAPGQHRLEARISGGASVVFRAEGTFGTPVSLEIRLASQGTSPPMVAPDTLRLSVGDVLPVTAFLTDALGNGLGMPGPRGVSWSSSADSIARFLASGTLLAVRAGNATIGVTTAGLVAYKPVIVNGP